MVRRLPKAALVERLHLHDERSCRHPASERDRGTMESSELRGWIDHRAMMLWVSITCLILMVVGVTIAVSLDGLSDDATLPLSIMVGAIGFFLWFCSFGAVMDIASMRSDMDDSLRTTAFGSQFAKAPFPAYLALTTIVMLGTPVMLIWMLNA
jgi:hypothetical protein